MRYGFGEKCIKQILVHKIFLNKLFSKFQFTSDLHDALNQKKSLKRLNLTGNEIFKKIRKIAFSWKFARGLEIARP